MRRMTTNNLDLDFVTILYYSLVSYSKIVGGLFEKNNHSRSTNLIVVDSFS